MLNRAALVVLWSFLLLAISGEVECHNRPMETSSSNSSHQKSVSLFESKIGINYGRIADNLLSPAQVPQLLTSSTTIRKVKIFDFESSVLNAFANSNFSMVVAAPNYLLADLASDVSKAISWINTSIAPFYPSTNITHIAIGNEVLAQGDDTLKSNLLPAMKNVYSALQKLKFHKHIKISTPHSLSVLANSYPPSNGSFADKSFMQSVLEFLNATSNPFMINVYPFFAYAGSPKSISLDFVLFKSNKGDVDPMSGLNYTSMFDAQLDAVHFAMQTLGFDKIPLIVSETGWPSNGDDSETGAGVDNAREYIRNLIKHVTSGSGTPVRPNSPIEVYIFALFNEDQKPGPKSERNYGLFQPNGSPVYNSGVLVHRKKQKPVRSRRSSSRGHHSRHQKIFQSSQSTVNEWCIAKPGAEPSALEKGIDFACAEGGIDCSAIRSDGSCFNPQNIFSHASYVYNSYFQKMGRNTWNCYFQDTATITVSDPSKRNCKCRAGSAYPRCCDDRLRILPIRFAYLLIALLGIELAKK